ncbi:hypothetical protein [Bremerella sp.]|uniref:hypothetical protein n=1 Tax=Bremerella sp. TaxID=2795602 RepID=UPI00391D0899
MGPHVEFEQRLLNELYECLLAIKSMQTVKNETFAEIEAMTVELLQEHKAESMISKRTASILLMYPDSLEAEAPYHENKEAMLAHSHQMSIYFGFLLAQEIPSDRAPGRIY